MTRSLIMAFAAVVPLLCSAQSALDLFNRARAGDASALAQLRTAADSGKPDSQFELGRAYSHGSAILQRDDAQAARWVEKAAVQGHLEAQTNLGYLYSAGLGVARDGAKAMSWWTAAAESGFPPAQFNLALSYLDGKLGTKDERKAFEWMSRAATQGIVAAQTQLAMLYRRGIGTDKNMEEAARWYRKASDRGNDTAMLTLAIMYVVGDGVARSPSEALRLLRRAESQGNSKAAGMREELCGMNPRLCESEPAPGYFVLEMVDPNLRIVIPDAPPMKMGPHPMRQPHARLMGGGPDGFTISVLVPTAESGMTPLDCARSSSSGVARRFGVKPEEVVMHRTNSSTLVMLFPFKADSLVQLKAFLLSGHGGTHCVEVHLSKTLARGAAADSEIAAWMKGFQRARIEAY